MTEILPVNLQLLDYNVEGHTNIRTDISPIMRLYVVKSAEFHRMREIYHAQNLFVFLIFWVIDNATEEISLRRTVLLIH